MAYLRFRKSVKVAPGVKLNISKSGVGVTTGVRGAHVGVNTRGSYSSVGIPGSGLYMMQYNRSKSGKGTTAGFKEGNTTRFFRPAIQTKTGTGLFGFLFKNNPSYIAKKNFKNAQKAYKNGDYKTAVPLFENAYDFFKDDKAIALLIASSYSQLKQYDKSIVFAKEYLSAYPGDYDIKKTMALWNNKIGNKNECLKILQLLPPEYHDSETLLIMSNIMTEKGLYSAAIDVLKRAPLRKRILTPDLVEIIYNLGLLYEKSGDKKRAESSFERVYAYDNSFKDVALKLGRK